MAVQPHLRDFTVPRPPGARPPWRFTPRRFAAGVGGALVTHLPPNLLLVLWAKAAGSWWIPDRRELPVLMLIAFALSLSACGIGAAWALTRRESGLGSGLVTGWVIGLIPAAVVAVSLLSSLPAATP